MDNLSDRLLVIVVVHIVIGLLQWAARRLIHLGGIGQYWIYITLLPIGFNCFGWKIPPLLIGGMALIGQFLVIWGVHKSTVKHMAA